MPNFKQKIFSQYQTLLQDKIDIYQDLIHSLTNDAQNDAKSSAGDKHETTLSKLHIEQEKIANKLKEALEQQAILTKLDIDKVSDQVILGSLVKTNHLTVFVGTALPKITVDNQVVFAISPQSPLGMQLMHKTINSEFPVNNVTYKILEIL
ncbi:GreA/GreB family elongation factor [Flavobacterium difficile]|uniref:GreA/GreB family elongation factor n=1 Tax=Flavobacterium difficile TaxID=2709659 RepID=A0ABX0I6E4_9FLAO|nr:GreA/GreB family elongation factor [Flavobacterium difficile]NHM02192.1 GreA/GreB family elongation factor [Flavobacterium difficile]